MRYVKRERGTVPVIDLYGYISRTTIMEVRKAIQMQYATMAAIRGQRGSGGESPAGRSLSQIVPRASWLFVDWVSIGFVTLYL
jgi:hypothetical protein